VQLVLVCVQVVPVCLDLVVERRLVRVLRVAVCLDLVVCAHSSLLVCVPRQSSRPVVSVALRLAPCASTSSSSSAASFVLVVPNPCASTSSSSSAASFVLVDANPCASTSSSGIMSFLLRRWLFPLDGRGARPLPAPHRSPLPRPPGQD